MKNEKIVYFGIGFVLAIILMFCYGNHRAGVNETRNQLNEARTNQSAITERISEAENTSRAIEQSTENLENGFSEAGDIIGECQRIISEVRKRNEAKNAQHQGTT